MPSYNRSRSVVVEKYEPPTSKNTSEDQYLSKGFLAKYQKKIVQVVISLLVLTSILAYFVKPKAPIADLVNPEQELANIAENYISDSSLPEKILDSYKLAFILVESPYTGTNVRALENLRSWAREKFQNNREFLHPVSIKPLSEPNDTIIGALGYNLFAPIKYTVESLTSRFLSWRIACFHDSSEYESFSSTFFDFFGKTADSATLLAKYQSEKAKQAIDILIASSIWLITIGSCLLGIIFSARKDRFEKIRYSLIAVWAFTSISYVISAWMENSMHNFISAIFSGITAIYFVRPFILLIRPDSSLKVTFIYLNSRWIALSVWATFSLMSILILTWIRSSMPETNDPVTLLLSGITGNFLYDPEDGKRLIARALGTLWLIISVWAFLQKDRDAKLNAELEQSLSSL